MAKKKIFEDDKIEMTELERRWYNASPVHYARFHQPVPPCKDKEPVSEFKLQSDQNKYQIEEMVWSWGDGLMWKMNGELDMQPAANVQYVRFSI